MQQPLQQPMQQPIPQDQITAQQMQQQMMLCPVRVVYETQILVPGDQLQPNQTLFINPQNPPPWSQNRQIHNPVIYVHQMPNNLIPTVQQHIDQNQLYLQQYQNYQQMIPQQILAQSQDQRPMQLSNVIPQNMVQTFQNNINTNVQNMQDRLPHNFAHSGNIGQNMQMQIQQRHINPNTIINSNDTNMHMIQAQQAPATSHRVEIKPGVFMNVAQPQPINQPTVRPPQVLTVNPIQHVSQASTNVQPMQTHNAPVSTPRSIQTQSVGSQMSPPTFVNPTSGHSVPRVRKVSPVTVSRGTAPVTVNRGTNMNVGVRGVQTYRPIQPRPQQQQFRANTPAVQIPNAISMQPQHKPMPVAPPVINTMSSLKSLPIIDAYTPHPQIKPEENINQRKRKSESPDEIHKKMAAIQVNITTPIKPVTLPQRSNETGMSNNSLNRPEQKSQVEFVTKTVPVKKEVELKKITNLVENVQQAIQIDKSSIKQNHDVKDDINNDKDKLIRNTVYMQARGRMLSDKESPHIQKDTSSDLKSEASSISESKNPSIVNIKLEKIEIISNETSTKNTYNNETINKKDMTDVSVTLNTANNKGMLPVNRIIKEEKDFVLTHVLDGIVIQESNVAFPIREPSIRRYAQGAAQALKNKNNPPEACNTKNITEKSKYETKETDNTPEQNNESGMKNKEATNNADNPFASLGHAVVKSWTTEQLSSHLSNHQWNETATLLIEHEIDGESLFLVSKTQLLTIGIKEDHAELICGFVKS